MRLVRHAAGQGTPALGAAGSWGLGAHCARYDDYGNKYLHNKVVFLQVTDSCLVRLLG